MSVIRVGSTSKYAENWAAIFGGKAAKKSTKKPAAKKTVAQKTKAVKKPTARKAKKRR